MGLDIELIPNDLELTLLNQSGNPFPVNVTLNNNDPFNYQYVVTNNGNIPLTADLAEYYKLDMNHPYFSGNSGAGNDWTCSIAMAAINSTTTCGNAPKKTNTHHGTFNPYGHVRPIFNAQLHEVSLETMVLHLKRHTKAAAPYLDSKESVNKN